MDSCFDFFWGGGGFVDDVFLVSFNSIYCYFCGGKR